MSYYDGSRGGGAARPHGTNARYQSGCRCDLCRRAKADYVSRYRNKGTASDNDVPPVVGCPTCGHPAYERPTGLQYAVTQPGHQRNDPDSKGCSRPGGDRG